MIEYRFHIDPVPAPRMVASDRWAKRRCVSRYFAFRNELYHTAQVKGLDKLPGCLDAIIFYMPMPKSWSAKKKKSMLGHPHTQVPDLDNILKSIFDCFGQDQHVHSIGSLRKIWAESGSIYIRIREPEKVLNESIKQNELFAYDQQAIKQAQIH